MLTNKYPFQKSSVLSKGFQLLKPNCHFSELQIQVMVPMFLGSVNVPMFAISTNLYFIKIGWAHQK